MLEVSDNILKSLSQQNLCQHTITFFLFVITQIKWELFTFLLGNFFSMSYFVFLLHLKDIGGKGGEVNNCQLLSSTGKEERQFLTGPVMWVLK